MVPSQSVPRQCDTRASDNATDIVPTLLSILQTLAPGQSQGPLPNAHSSGLRTKDIHGEAMTMQQENIHSHLQKFDNDGRPANGRPQIDSAIVKTPQGNNSTMIVLRSNVISHYRA